MSAVIVRILLRVIAGALAGWGLRDVSDILTSDPSVEQLLADGVNIAIGAIVWGGTEIWYWLAKKFGWRT